MSANCDVVASSCFTEEMSSALTGMESSLDDPLTVCGDHVLNVSGDDNPGDWEVSANRDVVASSAWSSTLTRTESDLSVDGDLVPLRVCGDNVFSVAGDDDPKDSESPFEIGVDRA